jgi:sugar lactone lactonase YvrE
VDLVAELIVDARAIVGEGPSWDAASDRLLWVDIQGQSVHVFDPVRRQDRVIPLQCAAGTIVPRARGGAVLATDCGFGFLDLDTGTVDFFENPEAQHPLRRFNDGKCDPQGRFWAGTLLQDMDRLPTDWDPVGTLYRLDHDHTAVSVLSQLTVPNGLTWSPAGNTFYFIDSASMRVDAFDFDGGSGTLTNRRPAVQIPPDMGLPDGMTSDAEGMLWIAHFFGGQVSRWNPRTGKLLGRILVPAGQVTSCVFGGERLDELYITTARILLDDQALREQPHAGGLFRAKPGVQGMPSFAYRG